MPLFLAVVAVVLIVIFAQVLIHPARPSRVRAFYLRNGLAPDADAYVTAQLARRRRYRTAGVIVGAIASGISTASQSKISVSFTWLLGGWFVGAVLAELAAAGGAAPMSLASRQWLRRVPYAIVIGSVVWTVVAMVARPSKVPGLHLIGWGLAAVACAGLIAVTVRQILRRTVPADVEEPVDRALRADAIAAITAGGTVLAILYLLDEVRALTNAVTVTEVTGLDRISVTWLIGAIVLGLGIGLSGRPGRDTDGNMVEPASARKYGILAVTAILVVTSIGFVVYYAGKGHAPYQPSALHAHATIRLTNDDAFTRDQAALGVTGLSALDPGEGAIAFVGRIDYTVPPGARNRGEYWIVVIDKNTNTAVSALWGNGTGQGWDASLDSLPDMYPWLQPLAPKIDGLGDAAENTIAATADPAKPGPLGIEGLITDDGSLTPADLEVAMIFQGSDDQIYWATKLPITS